jgi:anti-sigma B factor antagonist
MRLKIISARNPPIHYVPLHKSRKHDIVYLKPGHNARERNKTVKCYEITNCQPKDREACYVWNSFRDSPQDMDNIKCWILKGVYQEENADLYKKCKLCKYYLMMNRDSGIVSDYDADLAIITCEGTINMDRGKALEKTWETLKSHGKNKVLLDLTRVTNIYSSGLGTIITIHKSTQAAKGLLILVCPDGYVKNLFQVTKLSRLLKIVGDTREARDAYDAYKLLEAKKTAQPTAPETLKPKQPPKERPQCFVYWKDKNPRNATGCNECFKRIKPSNQPCWIVEGMIEGVSFQYVNEDCEDCPYFAQYGEAG